MRVTGVPSHEVSEKQEEVIDALEKASHGSFSISESIAYVQAMALHEIARQMAVRNYIEWGKK